ncbi:hypothetical protein [Streptomyces sp. URMC 123]|uniref:hypothetical protein n=1 Tax=Streptomyces sp. URMC 123 TaxID=3423403 RepID=UPI003F1D56F7
MTTPHQLDDTFVPDTASPDALALADLLTRPDDLLARVSGPVCTVRLGDHRLAVGSNEKRQVDYLRSLFVPGNALWAGEDPREPAAGDGAAVGLALPPADFRELLTEVRARSGAAAPVHMHVHAPAVQYTLTGGATATFAEATSEAEGPVLVVRSDRGLVCVSTTHPYGHLNFARQLREYGYRRAEDGHWVGFHASCAQLPDGSGALIVGRSGAGKSTVALALATLEGTAGGFVANDRVMIEAGPGADGAGPPRAVAMPVPIRLNAGTVNALGLSSAVRWKLLRPQPDYRTSDWARFGGGAKLSVLAEEWHHRTGTRLVDEVRPGVVVLPRARPTGVPLTVRAADPELARRMLTEQCMMPDDETFVEDWLGLRTSDRATLLDTARRAVARLLALPALTVDFGAGTELGELAAAIARAAGTAAHESP